MKNHHEISGIIINIVFALVVLAFIVIGLNKIGVYRLPESVEKLLGTHEKASNSSLDGGTASSEHEFVSFDEGEMNTQTGVLTYQNAESLIKKIDYNTDYAHKIVVYNYVGEDTYVENISLECVDGLYSASLTDEDDVLIRRVEESLNEVKITAFENGVETVVSLPKGSFDISDECGFLINAKDFINSNYDLEEADFAVFQSEYGAAVSVTFDNSMDSYSVKEKYVISLDFGVILSVESVHDGKTVYSMSTVMLENI